MSSTQTGKDTIYIDVDDEITTIIDKVRGSEHRIVALVLPKRATVLQSIVNMKLLKRTADEAKKHLVLITSEHSLMPLAGAVGLYVAKTLQSKPEIPMGPAGEHNLEDSEEAVDMNDASNDVDLDKNRPIGDYAPAVGAAGLAAAVNDDDEGPIELDNADPTPVAGVGAAGAKAAKPKKDKKLKVPDFNKFRLWLVLGGVGLVALIFLWVIAFKVMPRASISVKTDSTAIQTNMDLILSTTADNVDPASNTLPATQQQTQKTATQQVPATGSKDLGNKATGQVTFSLKDCSQDSVTIPAGTGVTANNLTYITQQTATLTAVKIGGSCKNSSFPEFATATANVTAQNAGDKYNADPTAYSAAGFNVDAQGSKMTGGTSNIVKIVSQADIDGAKQKIAAQNADAVKSQLKQTLQGLSLLPLDATFSTGNPDVSTSANVGDQTDNVTVTQKTTYTMVGIKESDLKTLIKTQVSKQIDTSKQAIIDYGISTASFKLQNQNGDSTSVSMADTAVAGSDLNLTELKKQVAGKKSSEAKSIISGNPGVTNVTVNYSPFWVSSIPNNTSKISITIEKPAVKNAQ